VSATGAPPRERPRGVTAACLAAALVLAPAAATRAAEAAAAGGLAAVPVAGPVVAQVPGAGAPGALPVAPPGPPPAAALPAPLTPPSRPSGTSAPLVLGNRLIVILRAEVYGYSPRERVQGAALRFAEVLARGGPGTVTVRTIPEGRLLELDGEHLVGLTPDDVFAPGGDTLDAVAARALGQLERVLVEHRESRSPRAIALAAGLSLLATVLYILVLRGAFLARRWLARRLAGTVEARTSTRRMIGLLGLHPTNVLAGVHRLVSALIWVAVIGVTYAWLAYVLERFAFSRVWGERLLSLLFESLAAAPVAMIEGLPSLLVVVVIFAVTRALTRLVRTLRDGVTAGRLRFDWLSADAARPTAGLLAAVLWVFALGMAYPYLPGAQTEAFKGLSVLVGVMVSLGASSVVGQAVSGLILMYTGAIRPGEYVRVGDTEGTVTRLGIFATRVRTGMGTEVVLPSAQVFSTAITNYSRVVEGRGFVLDTSVTIGYDAPWRQVHAMLVEAARRTTGVLDEPRPYVIQTALADFYVEYRLVAYAGPEAPRARADALNLLHANIQDVFNEHGVQIMSPHYMVDPAAPKVVPPTHWHTAPAPPPATTPLRA
jgi:small-conductance mechanosensitive channel